MGNGVSSLIFTLRSGDKAVNGDGGRVVTFAAQGVNAAESFAKTGVVGAKATERLVHNLDNVAKTETVWGKAARGLKWAQTHVNPIIGVCAATKVITADDKEKAFCTEVPGFLGMLAAEGQFKKFQKTPKALAILSKVNKAGGKYGKFLSACVEGVAFAAASIGGYITAGKIGEYAIEGERAIKARKRLEQLA